MVGFYAKLRMHEKCPSEIDVWAFDFDCFMKKSLDQIAIRTSFVKRSLPAERTLCPAVYTAAFHALANFARRRSNNFPQRLRSNNATEDAKLNKSRTILIAKQSSDEAPSLND
ncbi:hypothetical protein T02_7942 [Trichinella nativa]|uniref:Uncharacterized protein n=1 Tax=Trichinella nativa TaxID=6335 RepID=A0A0V1LCD0_9BILA|nr:hypothetical protein T02_7942 [Trichinella nativa]